MENKIVTQLVRMAAGNIGAANALRELTFANQFHIINKLDAYELKGTDIYVLYNDICDRDVLAVSMLVQQCPEKLLVNACKREDRSGKTLVLQYLES